MTALRALPPGFLAAVLITVLRLLVIDIDPPVRDLTDYLPKDEGFYVFPAYDLFERGQAFNEHPFRITGIPTITNVGAYIGLELFGDNYLGLRFGSVLFALIALLCFQSLLQRITQDRLLLNALPLVMVCDLSFGFASIMVEPTIARMAMMLVTMRWLVPLIERGAHGRSLLLHGMASTVLLLLTYPTNAFILPACWFAVALFTLHASGDRRKALRQAALHATGCLVGLALLIGALMAAGHNEFGQAAVVGSNYQDRIGISAQSLFLNTLRIPHANIFRLDPALLLVFLLGVVMLFAQRLRQWRPTTLVAAAFLLLLLAQTVFINDYPSRKLVILLPLVLLVLAASYQPAQEPVPAARRRKWIKAGTCLFVLAVTTEQVLLYINNAREASPLVMMAMRPGLVVVLCVAMTLLLMRASDSVRWYRARWLVALLVVPGLINTLHYQAITPTRNYKAFLESLRTYDRATFLGAASLGFRPYNTMVPKLNPYVLPNGYDNSWPLLEGMAKADSTTNYAVGYMDQIAEMRHIGFAVDRIEVLNSWETWRECQFVVYKEGAPSRTTKEIMVGVVASAH